MTKANILRSKDVAKKFVPQTRDAVVEAVAEIGRLQRERLRISTAMNDDLAVVRERYEAEALPLAERINELRAGVQTWCEAHRDELTENGKTKTAALASGEIRWRVTPPSVSIKVAEKVIEALRGFGLTRFLREKVEIDKTAILAEPEAVKGIKGITINQREEFVVVPFETSLEEVA